MQEILFKIKYLEKGLSKSLRKVNYFFLNPVAFNAQDCVKQKGPGTSDQFLFKLQIKFRKNFFISNVLPDQVC